MDEAFVLAQSTLDSRILPIIENACCSCHGDDEGEAGIDLAKYETVQQIIDGKSEWKAILAAVNNRVMPPRDASNISEEDREQLLTFIKTVLFDVDCQTSNSPGSVTIRRLTRFEYQNTIRDFLGVRFDANKDFPSDEVGYGFDNIGDVLSISPLQMEKYLDAAESISRQAIFDTRKIKPSVKWDGEDFDEAEHTFDVDQARVLTTNSVISLSHEVQVAGQYELTIRASEDPGGPENALMGVGANGVEAEDFEVNATKGKPRQYQVPVELFAGHNKIQVSFKNDYYDKDHPDPKLRDRNLIVRSMTLKGPLGLASSQLPPFALSLTKLVSEKKVDSKTTATNPEIRNQISLIASFAFRRLVTSSELDRLCELFDQSQAETTNVFNSMQFVLQALIVSPKFLFKIEESVAENSVRDLSQFELATALSYFLWSSMPDRELIVLASKGELNNPQMLQQQVNRMLADPKSSALVDNFASQWFQLRILENIDPDPKLFGEFDVLLRKSMIEETKFLFAEMIQQDLGIDHLLTSKSSRINQILARHYGLPKDIINQFEADEYRQIDMSGVGRMGILGQASFLTLTSNPTRTSPVKRGKWVLENLLAQPPPPPLPDVPALDNQAELTGTLRQRMSQHSSDQSCAVCHDQMDPIGFALEKFDAIGRFRELDEGQAIDDSGKLPDGSEFKGAVQLTRILSTAKRRDFVQCSVQKLLIYALGRGLEGNDDCTVNQIVESAMKGNDRFTDIINAIVLSDAFRKRGSGVISQSSKAGK